MGAALRILPGGDPSPDIADYFGQVPAGPVARTDISDRAIRILVALCILARRSRTWVSATIEEIAVAAGCSAKKTRQGLRELTSATVIEWDSIGGQFRVLFRLKGRGESGTSAPAPRVAPEAIPTHKPVPVWEPKWEPKREPVSAASSLLFEKREKEQSDIARRTDEISLPKNQEPAPQPDLEPITDDEIVQALIAQAIAVFTEVNPADVAAAVARHGAIAVEAAIEKCSRRSPRPSTFRYTLPMLEEWRTAGTVVTMRLKGEQEPVRQNYNPGPRNEPPPEPPSADELADAIGQARSQDPMIAKMFRATLKGLVATGLVAAAEVPAELLTVDQPAQKKPAAGPVDQTTPQPAGGPSLPPTPHYSVNRCSRSTAGQSEDRGQRARKDSNLQPSDSKSGGLAVDTIGVTPSLGASGAPPEPFPRPESAPIVYGPAKPPGSDVRGAMRC